MNEVSASDVRDVRSLSLENYKNIKPEGKHTAQEIDDFWKGEFQKESEAAKAESRNESITKEYMDDNGVKYREDDKLIPNNEYEVNGYKYKTDSEGRIISAEGKLKIPDEDTRKREEVRGKEGQEYREGDYQGHLIGHRFGGSDRLENLVPMDSKLNLGDFLKLENTLAGAVKEGKDVRMRVEPIYEGDSARPSEFRITYSIDGNKDIVVFKNESEVKP